MAALVALALSACGGGGQDSAKDEKVDKSARLANAFDKADINPLVGDWRRIRTCDEYVHQIKQAGLEVMVPTHQDHQDLVEEFGTGNAAQSHQDSDDPCQGVKMVGCRMITSSTRMANSLP